MVSEECDLVTIQMLMKFFHPKNDTESFPFYLRALLDNVLEAYAMGLSVPFSYLW